MLTLNAEVEKGKGNQLGDGQMRSTRDRNWEKEQRTLKMGLKKRKDKEWKRECAPIEI